MSDLYEPCKHGVSFPDQCIHCLKEKNGEETEGPPMTYIKAFLEANEMLGLKLTSLAVDEMSPEQFHLYQAARLAAPEIAELVEWVRGDLKHKRGCRVWLDGMTTLMDESRGCTCGAGRIRELVGE